MMRIVVVGCSPSRWTATSYLPQLVSIGAVLTSESAISWRRVEATPFSSNTASSRRRTTVSLSPQARAGSFASGAPLKVTVPVNGCEPVQKNPAGIGSLAKLVLAKPLTVIHMSTPLWTGSTAKAEELPTRAKIRATPKTNGIEILSVLFVLILRSFPGIRFSDGYGLDTPPVPEKVSRPGRRLTAGRCPAAQPGAAPGRAARRLRAARSTARDGRCCADPTAA